MSKLDKYNSGYKPLYQPSGRCQKRLKSKALQKNNWYRDGPRNDSPVNTETGLETHSLKDGRKGRNTSQKVGENQQMTTSTVMFVPNTKGGLMVNKFKKGEPILCALTDFKVKYAEAGGTPLMNMFNQDTGRGSHCRREVCHPCDGTSDEKRQNCRERSILYETSCKLCNPEEAKKGPSNPQQGEVQPEGRLGVYLGESSRSLHERMGEHVDDARKFRSGSHIVKHWMDVHPSLDVMPPWRFRTIRVFKDCLTRQLSEAVMISLSGDALLNGKCDYLANCISRVTVNEDNYERKKREFREEMDEKERLQKLEEFKKEKSENITGLKRKRSPNSVLNIKNIKRAEDNSSPVEEFQVSLIENSTLPIQSDQLSGNEPVAPILPVGWGESSVERRGDYASTDGGLELSGSGEQEKSKEIVNENIPGGWSVAKKTPKNKTIQLNYIMNLYGWTAWWERNCKLEKNQKISKSESNQTAKLSFLKNFSSRGIAHHEGSTTPKRLREEDNLSNGEMKPKFQRKLKMSWDCGGGDIATNSSIKKKVKIYKTVELAEKPDLDLD